MPKTSLAGRADVLKKLPFFATMNQKALQRIAKAGTTFEVPAGHVLVQPHLPGSGLFVIEEGTVVVERPGKKPLELGPGEWVGELSLLTDKARSARVRAKTEVLCLAIGRQEFRALLEEDPKLALALLEVLANRLAEGS